MSIRYLIMCMGVLTPLLLSGAHAEDSSFDTTGRGAVLCIFLIHVQVLAQAEHCSPEDAPEIQDALRQSIVDIEEFIVANSSWRREDVTRYRNLLADRITHRNRVCEKSNEIFEMYRKRGADAIRASTRELLAVPREPKSNPCL
jgi:hypothetical protein